MLQGSEERRRKNLIKRLAPVKEHEVKSFRSGTTLPGSTRRLHRLPAGIWEFEHRRRQFARVRLRHPSWPGRHVLAFEVVVSRDQTFNGLAAVLGVSTVRPAWDDGLFAGVQRFGLSACQQSLWDLQVMRGPCWVANKPWSGWPTAVFLLHG